MSFNRQILASAVVLAGFAATASAGTVYDFSATDTLTVAAIPGTAVGETVALNVYVDNGGSTDLSQTWNLSDVVDFTYAVGTYFATYSKVYGYISNPLFTTDGSGLVTTSQFYGTDPSSVDTDNFGTITADIFYGNGEVCDTRSDCNEGSAGGFYRPSQWSVSAVSSVPEPTSLALIGSGLAGLGFIRRRRRA